MKREYSAGERIASMRTVLAPGTRVSRSVRSFFAETHRPPLIAPARAASAWLAQSTMQGVVSSITVSGPVPSADGASGSARFSAAIAAQVLQVGIDNLREANHAGRYCKSGPGRLCHALR